MGIIKPFKGGGEYIWVKAKEGINSSNYVNPQTNDYMDTFNFWVSNGSGQFLSGSTNFVKQKYSSIIISSRYKDILDNILNGFVFNYPLFIYPDMNRTVLQHSYNGLDFYYRLMYCYSTYTADYSITNSSIMANITLLIKRSV